MSFSDVTRRRKYLYWLVLVTITIGGIVILDVLFGTLTREATLNDLSHPMLFEYHPRLGIAHRPHAHFAYHHEDVPGGEIVIKTNNLGFREDTETNIEKTTEYRVMVFGDSHTDGAVDNENSFPNVAEAILRSKDFDIEIINAGVMQYSPYQMALMFEEWIELDPDVAVFALYCGNDYADMLITGRPHLAEDAQNTITEKSAPPPPEPPPIWKRLLARSYMVRYLQGGGPDPASGMSEKMQAAFSINAGAVWQTMHQNFHLQQEGFDKASRLVQFTVRNVKEFADKHDVQVLFLILPTSYQTQPERYAETFESIEEILELDSDEKMERRVRMDLIKILESENLNYLDVTPALREAPVPAYWRFDHHLNNMGCAIVGRSLSEALAEMLVDDPASSVAGD